MDIENFINDWKVISDKIGGHFISKENIRANVNGLINKIEIKKKENNGEINIEQTIIIYGKNSYKNSLATISYKAISTGELSLQIWRKSFFEKVFNSGVKTGDGEIDGKFYIKSNAWDKLSVIFQNEDFKNYILMHEDLFFSINTIHEEVIITLKVNTVNDAYDAYLILCQLVKRLKPF